MTLEPCKLAVAHAGGSSAEWTWTIESGPDDDVVEARRTYRGRDLRILWRQAVAGGPVRATSEVARAGLVVASVSGEGRDPADALGVALFEAGSLWP